MKRNKHKPSWNARGRNPRGSGRVRKGSPRTADEFFARSEEFQDKWNRVAHVISHMRAERVSLPQATKEYNLDPRTVVRLGRPALRKLPNGRYAAKAWDRLLRVITVNTSKGLREVATRDSREASIAAMDSAAVQRYLQTGDDSGLRKLPRKYIIDANGKRIKLLTKREDIDRLGNAGVLSFESLYARSA